MNEDEKKLLNEWLNDPASRIFEKHLDLIMAEVGIQLLDNNNYNADGWKFFTDYLMGKRIGVDIIRRVMFKLNTKKNNASKIAKWKGVYEIFNKIKIDLQGGRNG